MTEELKPTHVPDPSIVEQALAKLHARSFSQRNIQLGRMLKCQICGLRHHMNEHKCVQQFAKFEDDTDVSLEQIVKDGAQQTVKMILGAQIFAKKRYHPHPNQRKLQFIQLVRSLLPDEYTKEELEKARKKAARVMVKIWGRHGFFSPVWKRQPEPEVPNA